MRKKFAIILVGALAVTLSSGARASDLPTDPTAATPYVGTDYLALSHGGAWNKVIATILNPCTATLAGTVPVPPDDPTKFLNGQCNWAVPPGGGGGGSWGIVGTSAIVGGTSGRFLFDNGGLLGEQALGVLATTTPGTGVATWISSPSAANFAAALIGPVTVGAGGSGAATMTANALVKGNGSSPYSASALSDDGTKISISEPLDLTSKPVEIEVANASSTGTTLNKLAKLTGAPATALITATTDLDGAVGVVNGGAGTGGNARIAVSGQVNCVFDTATTAGNYVGISPTVPGDCRDLGPSRPSAAQTVGRVLSTNGSGGTYAVILSSGYTNTGSGITGFGVDNGTGSQSVTGSGAINTTARLVKIATGWVTGTLTLPPISSVSPDAAICVADGAQYVDGSHILTIQPNGADSIGGGAAGAGSAVVITAPGGNYCFRVSAAHNWTQDGIPTSAVGATTIVSGLSVDGLTYAVQTAAQIGASPANHAVPVVVAGASIYKVIPDCPAGGVGFTQSTDAFGCNLPTYTAALTWAPGINPNNLPIVGIYGAHTLTAVTCRPEVAAGGAATIQVVKAPSGTALSAGTVVTTATCDANGTAATNQVLTPSNTSLANGDTLGIKTTGTTIWTSSGIASGHITVTWQ